MSLCAVPFSVSIGVEGSYMDDSNSSAPPSLVNPSTSNADGVNIASMEAQQADLTVIDSVKSLTVAAVTSDLIDLSHLRYHLTPENRYIDIDDISEIRPGKVSPIVDGATSIEENDSLFLSIIASETILVLPLPSILVRNNLIRRFQAFLLVSPSLVWPWPPWTSVSYIVLSLTVVCLSLQTYKNYESLNQNDPELFRPSFPYSTSNFNTNQGISSAVSTSATSSQHTLLSFNPVALNNSLTLVNPEYLKKLKKQQKQHASPASPTSGDTSSNGKKSDSKKKKKKSSSKKLSTVNNVTPKSSTSSAKSSTSPSSSLVPSLLSTPTAANRSYIYSHIKQTRSVSVVRKSSSSSRGQSSISESFHSNILGGSGRTHSQDF
jgi:hypothetical protein